MDGAECFVAGCFAKVLRVARFVGVAPLSFVREGMGWRVRLSSRFKVYGYCFISIVILSSVVTMIDLLTNTKTLQKQMKTKLAVSASDLFLTILTAGVVVFGSPNRMQSMINSLNHLHEINSKLNIRTWPGSASGERKKVIIFVSSATYIVGLSCWRYGKSIYRTNGAEWKDWMFISISICFWIQQLQTAVFIVMTFHVLHSFRAINKALRDALHVLSVNRDKEMLPVKLPYRIQDVDNKKSFNDDATRSDSPSRCLHHRNIRTLAKLYMRASSVVADTDRCHGLLLLILVAFLLFNLTLSLYLLIKDFNEANKAQYLSADIIIGIFMQLNRCLIYMANMTAVIEPCHQTLIEMKTTRGLVSHLMLSTYSEYDPLAVQLDLFSQHLLLNQVSYSPLKVITLTRSLLATILGSITTYLVILVEL